MPPRRTRRSQPRTDRGWPRPPAGNLEPIEESAPVTRTQPPARVAPAPEESDLYARFETASSALAFAEQLPSDQPLRAVPFLRGGPADAWWVAARLTLDTAREMVSVDSGRVYLPSGDSLLRDRGWGEPVGAGEPVPRPDLHNTDVRALIRAAGLHRNPGPPRPLSEAVLLLPGYLVAGITRRALDLDIDVTYGPVTLTPLFEPDSSAHVSYQLCLSVRHDAKLPVSLLDALNNDPFILVCRRAAEEVLIRYRFLSPLSGEAMATLVEGETWVLADASYGCARLRPVRAPQDGASLVRRGPDHELTDPEASWTTATGTSGEPERPTLGLARAGMRGVQVDAVLLDDAELNFLPALLVGEPLADTAVLVRGRDRHLLTAPGGLLEQLPVGESLYCLGPGNLYLPFGFRMQPSLPSRARRALFPTNASIARVVLPGATLCFDMTTRQPVWRLWAGPIPPVVYELPPEAYSDVIAIDRDLTPAEPEPRQGRPARPSALRQFIARLREDDQPHDWRDDAHQAELAGDYVNAAELHVRHGDLPRAARLYERAAQAQ